MIEIILLAALITPEDNYFKGMDHIDKEEYEQALLIFDNYAEKHPESYYKGHSVYMKAYCLAHTLQQRKAIIQFSQYLRDYPDAPERMKIGADRWIRILSQDKLPLSPVQEKMEYVARKLRLEQTDKTVKMHQKDIVSILDSMIEMSEDQEKKDKQKKENKEKEQKKTQQEQEESNQGKSDKPGESKNPDGRAKKRKYKGEGSDWSKLRERERDPAFNALKEKFPARYKDLVEKYYRSFK